MAKKAEKTRNKLKKIPMKWKQQKSQKNKLKIKCQNPLKCEVYNFFYLFTFFLPGNGTGRTAEQALPVRHPPRKRDRLSDEDARGASFLLLKCDKNLKLEV
jgi:hypothetical protein